MTKTLGTLLVALALTAGVAPAAQANTPAPEGGDTRPCATYREFNLLRLDMRRVTVRRILDTRGHKVGKRAFDGVPGMFGVAGQVDSAPLKRRQVRLYPTCAEDGVPATLLVEYRMRHGRGRAVQIAWY